MHSSCIVVRLDWAAGLPAWLIRRFGSPDLTRKTLFTSQKHQTHSSWDRNEDSWLTLSIDIYSQALHQSLRVCNTATQSLTRLCLQCRFVESYLELQHEVYNTTFQSCWNHHHHTLESGKPVLVSAMAKTEIWRIQTSSQCGYYWTSPSLRIKLASYTSLSVTWDWFYTSAMHIQCFSQSNRNIYIDVNWIPHIPA